MPGESIHNLHEKGELKFDYIPEKNADDDLKFTLSIKNLLVLIKDFYGADGCAVYWFNRSKKSFKLLTSSEDEQWSNYSDRFKSSDDALTISCLKKTPDLYDNITVTGNQAFPCFKDSSKVKSVIINPLEIDGDVIALILCESKTENFFGNPNLYSLQVFSESVISFINYYSLKEECDYQNAFLQRISSGRLKTIEDSINSIQDIISRYFDVEHMIIIGNENDKLELIYMSEPASNGFHKNNFMVQDGSIVHRAISEKQVFFSKISETDNYRYFKEENLNMNTFNICIPVFAGERLLGVISFDTQRDPENNLNDVKKIVNFIYPFFYYLKIIGYSEKKKENEFALFDKNFFDKRLSSEINKCRLFNSSELIVVFTSIDKPDSILEYGISLKDVLMLYSDELIKYLNGYDMIFSLDNNLLSIIFQTENCDNVFLELEKIRKSISTNIYTKDGKEFNFTVSFAFKKYDKMVAGRDDYLLEIENLLNAAIEEGGNVVKF